MNPSSSSSGEPRYIDNGYLELVEVIGTGAYGSVWRAVDGRYPDLPWRAVKSLRRHGLDERQRMFQRREITLHQLASNHPSIITLWRVVEEEDYTYLVMDYGEEGDMFAMICEQQRYVGDDELIRSVFLQILDGITQLHSYGIVHRDLKCENIVCSDDGRRVRICDFGLATSEVHSSEFGCGSTFYIAPESIGENRKTRKSYPTKPGDIWSLGVILVNLVCARNPWRSAISSDKTFNTYLQDPSFLRRILPISLELQTILQGIFCVDPEKRVKLRTLREQIRNCGTFSMSQDELIAVHAAAAARVSQARPTRVPDLEGMEEEDEDEEMSEDDYDSESEDEGSTSSVRLGSSYASEEGADGSMLFELEVEDGDIPYLQPDTGSPSPPVLQSRSSSGRSGSLPPTPFYLNQSKFPALHNTDECLIDGCVLCHATGIRSDSRLSPNDITVAMRDPFFAPSKSTITNPRLSSVVPTTCI